MDPFLPDWYLYLCYLREGAESARSSWKPALLQQGWKLSSENVLGIEVKIINLQTFILEKFNVK